MSEESCRMFDEMSMRGFNPKKIIQDGKFHRFDIDRKGDNNGYYAIDNSGYGIYGSWKTGERFVFRGIIKNTMTLEERRINDEARKEVARVHAAEKTRAQRHAAGLALTEYLDSKTSEYHWYLDQKGIKAGKSRVNSAGDLLVPIYKNKNIVNLQRITKERKLYLKGGEVSGCYHPCSGDVDVIFIAEGFATAMSINNVTGRFVLAAMDSGNLLNVAKYIRGMAGDNQRIVICADNDQWTKINGENHNTGVISAMAAAKEINADVIMPPFKHVDTQKRTDWNDYESLMGLENMKEYFESELGCDFSKSHFAQVS